MHPLSPNLSDVTLDELEKKRSELSKNLYQCYNSGRGGMANQIQMLLMDYEEEIRKRHDKILDKAQKDSETLASRIDIGK